MNPNEEPKLQHPEEPLNHLSAPDASTMHAQPTISSSADAQSAAPDGQDLPPVAPLAPTDTPPQTHSYAHPIPDSPKKTYDTKRFKIILGVVVGVCILAVITMLLLSLLPVKKAPSAVDPNAGINQTATKQTVSAKQAIDHVKEYFKDDKTAKSPITLPVLATGKPFYTVIPDTKPLVSVAGEVTPENADAQLNSIEHSLEGDDFAKRVTSNGTGTTNYLADFTRAETFCEVAITKPTDSKANQWFEVRCLDMANYVDYADVQKPLVNLYTPLTATSVQYGFVGKPAPKASKTAGYKLAELEVSIVVDSRMTSTGKYALFYQSADGLWHYFRDRDAAQAFDCDEYKSDDLKNAYLGVSCRNTSKGTTETVEAPKKKS